MAIIATISGIVLIVLVLWEGFETIILPRRVTRRFRLTRFFYRSSWRPWVKMVNALIPARRQETWLSYFGPISLLDARAGSPPTVSEMLCRHTHERGKEALGREAFGSNIARTKKQRINAGLIIFDLFDLRVCSSEVTDKRKEKQVWTSK